MEDLLKKNGWAMFSQCSCGGTNEKKFKNNRFLDVVVFVYPSTKKFTIKKKNRQIAAGNDANFETKLIEYGFIKEIEKTERPEEAV